jgi:glycosyltransferase involved in cell wall biosynthesis
MRPELRLIANDGNQRVRRDIEALAARLAVPLTLRWRIPDAALHEDLWTARVFVYGAHSEPLGLGPLEAMAHGLPVVAVGEGGVVETVEHGITGFLCRRDPIELGSRIRQLLASSELREAMGQAGRRTAEANWRWSDRSAVLEWQLSRLHEHAPLRSVAQ